MIPILHFLASWFFFVFMPRKPKKNEHPPFLFVQPSPFTFSLLSTTIAAHSTVFIYYYIGHRFVSVVPHTSQFMLVAVFFLLLFFFTRLLFQFFVIMLLWTCLTIRIPPLQENDFLKQPLKNTHTLASTKNNENQFPQSTLILLTIIFNLVAFLIFLDESLFKLLLFEFNKRLLY